MTEPVPSPFADLAAGAFGRRNQAKPSRQTAPTTSGGGTTPRAPTVRSTFQPPLLSFTAPKLVWDEEERDHSYRELSVDERLDRADKIFVFDDQAYNAVMTLDSFRKDCRTSGNLVVMAGPSGTGKKKLTERYAARFEVKRTPRYDTLTVARADLFGQTDGRNLLFAILKSLEHPAFVKSSNPYEALRLIGEWVKARQTEMIVVLAAEQLCPNGRMPDEVVNLIGRILQRRLIGTLVLVGDPVLLTAVDATRKLDTHIRARLPLTDLAFEDEAEAKVLRERGLPLQRDAAVEFLTAVAWDLPFDPNGLNSEMMAERFHVADGGNRGIRMNLIYGAAQVALKANPKTMVFGSEHLAVAFARLWPDRVNPFLTVLPPRKGVPVEILEGLLKKAQDLAALNR
ncbi:ATP-binding protein [Microvirga sp. 17 mud 1-3]|uniref:ATP-binding protein n=1 Tax=Microvirga sp. 17 mud 1-3 TaxID=2082949 RepID=UPI0013A5B014|nr:ATP-binding protein [Microvirga sp. 17 mud 1-3]